MPLFGTEYESEHISEVMGFEASFEDGSAILISPHLCHIHQHDPNIDHRGFIDITQLTPHPIFGVPLPATQTISLTLASILVEGLTEVAPYVLMNMEADEPTEPINDSTEEE